MQEYHAKNEKDMKQGLYKSNLAVYEQNVIY